MSEQAKHFYEFGRFRIDTAQRLLLRDLEVVALTPKVFEMLLTLVESGGEVVSKDSLMKKVWPDTFVEEGNLTQNISLLRKALGEGHSGLQYIETVARRGYRFAAPVQDIWGSHSEAARGNGVASGADVKERNSRSDVDRGSYSRAHPGGLRRRIVVGSLVVLVFAAAGFFYFARANRSAENSNAIEPIAVLPFVNEASDSDAEYFSDEVTESLINNLSQLPKLRVVPRSVTLSYKEHESDPRKIARDLNVRAVLTGRIHRRGDMLSIQVDLIDVASVSQMWGQHYDR